MYQMRCRKSFCAGFLLASLCMFIRPTNSQGAPSVAAQSPWRDPNVSGQYRQWLREDVVYIVTGREREQFRNLTSDKRRDEFIATFWERRNPTPGSVHNPFKEEHYRRIASANEHFAVAVPGWMTDRGRVYIVYGRPDSVESHPKFSPPTETWRYASFTGRDSRAVFTFVDKYGNGNYQLIDRVINPVP